MLIPRARRRAVVGLVAIVAAVTTACSSVGQVSQDASGDRPTAASISEGPAEEWVEVKYRSDPVNVAAFIRLPGSGSLVRDAWYDPANDYLIIDLGQAKYHYCDVPAITWASLGEASSQGEFYTDELKGEFDCRDSTVPTYPSSSSATSEGVNATDSSTIATTTTVVEYELADLDLGTLVGWSLDEVDEDFLLYASESCENTLNSVGRLAQVLSDGMIVAWELTLSAIDVRQDVVGAVDEWATVATALPYGGRAITFLLERSESSVASGYAERSSDTIGDAIFVITPFRLLAHDVQTLSIDLDAVDVWGDDIVDLINEFRALSFEASQADC